MTNHDWLDAIEQREQKATEGPSLDTAKLTFAAVILNHPDMGSDMRFVLRLIDEVAHARTDVLKLCKEVRKLRVERLCDEVKQYRELAKLVLEIADQDRWDVDRMAEARLRATELLKELE